MSRTLKVMGLALVLVSFGAIAFAESHEEGPGPVYVWINAMKAKPGQGEALTGLMMTEDAKMFDPLVEKGAALEWGIALPIVHDGHDAVTHYEWVTFAGWEGVDTFMADFMASRQSMSEDDMKAMNEKWEAAVAHGSHADIINRSVYLGPGAMGRPGYIHLGYYTANPGQEEAAYQMYTDVAAPVYDGLVESGAIQNYGLHVPAVRRNSDWTFMSWFASQNLAARDAVSAAFDGVMDEETHARMSEIFTPDYTQQILLVVHHKMAGGGGEDEGDGM